MHINQQYMYMLTFDIVRCVFLLFYVLMKHCFICVNIVMKYILTNFMLYVRGNFNNVTIYI